MDGALDIFDFIVVGAGSAGAVLAERLSSDGRTRVLLLEEGPSDPWMSQMPKGYGRLIRDPEHAHFYPIQNDEDSGRTNETWVRGKMLGGSSAINGMVWTRSGSEDYDRLEQLGNPGWGWSEMLPYLRKLEDHEQGADEFRGTGGPVHIKTNPNRTRLADAFISAGVATGLKVKSDQNGPELEGVGYAQWNIDRRGRRMSTASTFLARARGRKNLLVKTGVRVERVLLEGQRAVGVVGASEGRVAEYRVRGEVLLAAGALVSPKILQLSGIGDGAVLKAAGVPIIHHSPNVGRRMHEHVLLALSFRLREWRDSDNREYSGLRLLANVVSYQLFGLGPMARGAAEAIAFVRAVPGANRPDTQIMFNRYSMAANSKGIAFEGEPGMQCYSYILRPTSEGHALITTSDPSAPMDINPKFLTTEEDRVAAVAGTRAIRRILSQPAFADLVIGEVGRTVAAQTDEEILDQYRRFGSCGFHAVGTAAMGPEGTDVVDARLRVRGIEGLRVVDCSIFPEMPSGNTNAPVMAAALRVADLIQADARR